MKTTARFIATLALALVGAGAGAHQYWNGNGEGNDWNTPANWRDNKVPGDGENAYFSNNPDAKGVNVTFADSYTMSNELIVEQGSTNDTDTVTFTADTADHGVSMTNTSYGRIKIGNSRAGSLTLAKGTYSGANYASSDGVQFYIGYGYDGILRILEGATMKAGKFSAGYRQGNEGSYRYGYGYTLLDGGMVDIAGGTYVGDGNATGRIDIVRGTWKSKDFTVGQGGAPGIGIVEVRNEGNLDVTASLNVGNNKGAYGELVVGEGGKVKTSILRAGGQGDGEVPSVGNVVIDGGELIFDTVYLADNKNGNTGIVDVVSGKFEGTTVNIGQTSGGYGELIYRGGTLSGTVNVGNVAGATGKFTVKGTDYVSGSDFKFPNAYATGILEVGSGGTFTVPNLYIAGKDKNGSADSHYAGYATVYTNGTLATTGFLSLGKGGYSESKLTVDGGTVTAATGLYLARDNSWDGDYAKSEVEVKNGGRLAVSANGVTISRTSGGQGTIRVSGEGTVDIAGNIVMTYSGNSTGIVEVAEGVLNVSGDLTCGSSWAGALSTYTQTGGTATFGGVLALGGTDNSSTGNHSEGTITLGGGSLETKGITLSGQSGNVYSLIFDGGTLKANASANMTFVPSDSRLAVSITANGGAIDTNGKNLTVASTITGTGTLTKKGSGTLTLGVTPAFPIRIEGGNVVFPENAELTSKITVAAGAVYVYDPSLTYAGGIEVEEGGVVVWNKTDYTSGTQYDLPAVTFLAGASAAGNLFVNTGARTTEDFSVADKVTITDLDAEAAVTTKWTGADAAANNSWTNAVNWTHGVPGNADTAVIWFDSEITGSALQTGENSWTAGMDKPGALQFENDATLVYVSPDTYRVNPKLVPGAVTGTGTLTLYMANLATDGVALEIPETVSVVSWTENQHAHAGRRNLITGTSGARITIKGSVMSPNGGRHPTQRGAGLDSNDYDFQNAFIAEYVDFEGALVINSYAEPNLASTSEVEGRSVQLRACNVSGNISGKGTISIPAPNGWSSYSDEFSGDNSAFEGTVYATRNINFASAAAGSAKAYWWLPNCDVTFSFASGTISLGNLSCETNGKIFSAPNVGEGGIAVEIGKGSMGGKKYLATVNGNAPDVTLKKVAFSEDEAGVFTYAGYGFPKIEVAAGEFTFRDDSATSEAYGNASAFAVSPIVAVASGATLSGTNYTNMAIASLTLADGAFVAAPGTKLTNVGTASLDGAKVLVADTEALTAGARYDLVTTTSGITGAPYWAAVDAVGNDVPATNGKAKNWWLAKVSGGKNLVLREGNPNAGFTIIFR